MDELLIFVHILTYAQCTWNVQKSAGKLAGQYVDHDSDEPKKKRSRVVGTVRPSVMSQFRGVDSATVKKADFFFSFCVVF